MTEPDLVAVEPRCRLGNRRADRFTAPFMDNTVLIPLK
jgi:hypothetical protein